MPLGSATKSTIDIDFTRAQGVNSSGRIMFEPPRIRIGTTMISRHKVLVEVVNGIATVELVRLPTGTYHVREEIDGRAPYEFDFALPTGSAATIQYEEIAAVSPVPVVYTVVRTVNGIAPNPTTGNVDVEGGGGGPVDLDDLTDVTIVSPINGQTLVYDSVSGQWENLALTPGDVGAAPTSHTHPSSQITDFQTAVDARVQLIVDTAPSALDTLNELAAALGDDPDFAGTVTLALSGKQPLDSDLTTIAGLTPTDSDLLQRISGAWANRTPAQVKISLSLDKADVGLVNANNTSDANKPVSTAQQSALDLKADLDDVAPRTKAFASSGRQTVVVGPCNTSGSWTLCPVEYRVTIPAEVGDILHWTPRIIAGIAGGDAEIDVASVVSGVAARFYSSGTTSQAPNGHGGLYLGVNYVNGFNAVNWVVSADDIEDGEVTLAFMYRAGGSGTLIGSAVYPGQVDVVNHGPVL